MKEASTDADFVADWWSRWPGASIGVATGTPSGVWVLDVDAALPAHTEGERVMSGPDALAALERKYGPLPQTLEAATGGGGRHLFFALPPGPRRVKNRGRLKGPSGQRTALDVRGDGGYVVVAPSPHASGRTYEWSVPEVEPAAAPEWLLELVDPSSPAPGPGLVFDPTAYDEPADREERYGKGVLDGAARRISTAPKGARHDTIVREAFIVGQWVAGGVIAEQEAENVLTVAGVMTGKDPAEVRRAVVDSLTKGAASTPRTAPVSGRAAPTSTRGMPSRQDIVRRLHRSADRRHRDTGEEILGTPKPTIENAVRILRDDPDFAGRLSFDLFSSRMLLDGIEIVDVNVVDLRHEVDHAYRCNLSAELGWDAVSLVSHGREFHPLQNYLNGLTWDGVPRLATLLATYFGAEPTPLNERYGARWAISAVARAFYPGCKVDNVLVLKGAQGSLKSSGLKAMCPRTEWFSDDNVDVQSREGAIALLGKWIVEIAELESFRGKAQTAIKAFLSRAVDHYRPVHARATVDQPRASVFVASTNADTFLQDPTGSRRFWVVRTGVVRTEALERDRDQIWAEAVVAYKNGEQWYLRPEEEEERQAVNEQFQIAEPWEPLILTWLDTPEGRASSAGSGVTTTDVLRQALSLDAARMTRAAEMTVGDILRRCGFVRKQSMVGGVRAWRYIRV